MQESLHVGALLIPRRKTVNGEGVAKVMNPRLLACIRSADTGAIAQDTKSLFERIRLDGLRRRRDEKRSVSRLSFRQTTFVLSQYLF